MNDPPRLLTADSSGMGAQLLRSAHGDDPPPAARQRMLVALSLGSEALVSAATASGATAASGAGGGFAAVALKWAGVGIAAGALTITAAEVVQPKRAPATIDRPETSAPAMAVAPAGAGEAARAPRAAADVSAAPAAQKVASELLAAPTAPASAAAPRVSKALGISAPPELPVERAGMDAERAGMDAVPSRAGVAEYPIASAASLSEEVLTLDRARDQLARRQPESALQMLDRYDGEFPQGRLALESKVLRIEALAARGDRASAARLARELLATYPSSAHVARVRSLLVSLEKGEGP